MALSSDKQSSADDRAGDAGIRQGDRSAIDGAPLTTPRTCSASRADRRDQRQHHHRLRCPEGGRQGGQDPGRRRQRDLLHGRRQAGTLPAAAVVGDLYTVLRAFAKPRGPHRGSSPAPRSYFRPRSSSRGPGFCFAVRPVHGTARRPRHLAEGKIHAWTKGVPVEDAAQLQVRRSRRCRSCAASPSCPTCTGGAARRWARSSRRRAPSSLRLSGSIWAAGSSRRGRRSPPRRCPTPSRICARASSAPCRTGAPTTAARATGARGAKRRPTCCRRVGQRRSGLDAHPGEVPEAGAHWPGHDRAIAHLGTLGTGNHFIEVCLDQDRRVWVMLHSGSRGIGNSIGSFFIEKAKEEMERWFINLPNQDLAYIPEGSVYFKDYVEAVEWAQEYAAESRKLMLMATLKAMRASGLPEFAIDGRDRELPPQLHLPRAPPGRERHRHAQGRGVRARGPVGIIPGSMGARSYIVRGKGNRDALTSCSHGAGRAMSRTEARRRFTVEDHLKPRPRASSAEGRVGPRRDAGRLQGHRRGDGGAGVAGRAGLHAQAGPVREGRRQGRETSGSTRCERWTKRATFTRRRSSSTSRRRCGPPASLRCRWGTRRS
jgi:hypothetical protein